jgi:predicted DNA-binding protein
MIKSMEVHLTAETEKKLKDLSALSGRATDELVEDAMAGYFAEVQQISETLNGRYDDLKGGKVKPISGEEVEARFREKSADARSKPGS